MPGKTIVLDVAVTEYTDLTGVPRSDENSNVVHLSSAGIDENRSRAEAATSLPAPNFRHVKFIISNFAFFFPEIRVWEAILLPSQQNEFTICGADEYLRSKVVHDLFYVRIYRCIDFAAQVNCPNLLAVVSIQSKDQTIDIRHDNWKRHALYRRALKIHRRS